MELGDAITEQHKEEQGQIFVTAFVWSLFPTHCQRPSLRGLS